MKKAPIPLDDDLRLETLRKYKVLDTSANEAFDEITKLASMVCGTKIALVSLIDESRQWFKSKYGLDAEETPRDISFCGHAIMGDDVFIVENALLDDRFSDNPLVVDGLKIRFYAGAPLVTPDGQRIGTLCVIDDKEKKLDKNQEDFLRSLSKNIINLLELNLKSQELDRLNQYLDLALEGSGLGIWDWCLTDNSVAFDKRWASMLGLDVNDIEMELKTWESRVHPDDLEQCYADIKKYMDGETDHYENIHRMRHANGHWVYILDKGKFSDFDKDGKPVRFTGTHLDITDVRKAQEEQKFILSYAKVGMWKWNLIEDKLVWDESMYKLYGISPEDFSGARDAWESMLHPDYMGPMTKKLNKVIEGGRELDTTFAICTSLGEVRYIGVRGTVERDQNGKAIYMYGINWDKTSEYEKSLEMKTLLNSVDRSALVSRADVFGRITYANAKFQEVSGYSIEELLGEDHRMVNSGYHPKSFFEQMWSTIKAGKQWKGEICNKAKDGTLYWVDSTITPSVDEQGKIQEFLSFRYDITKQKEQEIEQRRIASEKAVINKLLEIKKEEDQSLDEILNNALSVILSIPWLESNQKGGIFLEREGSLELIASKGLEESCGSSYEETDRTKNHYFIPIINKSFTIGGIIIYIEDVHNRREEEESFLSSCADVLSSHIEMFNYEKEIIRKRDEALAGERAKTLFLANMSHEIRTPMNGIIGMLELLGATDLTNDQREMLETSESCSESLLTILNDILDLSKIESGKMSFEPIPFNLKECIEQAIYLLNFSASQKKLDVTFQSSGLSHDWYIGDITRIRQILINLISNAIKFTETGSVKVRLEVEDSEDQSNITVSVSDTGIGISKDVQEKLFNDFLQADSSTTRKFGGTGLGLSISKRLIEMMDGEISVDSELGKGSTFTFKVPLKKASPGKVNRRDDYVITDIKKQKILVVEDNKMNQKIAKMMLKKVGFDCDFANDGKEGVEAVTKGDYTLVFMDMQMPVKDGVTATKEILEIMKDKAPQIVAMTANAFADDRQKCFDAGMVDFVAKPIKISELKRIFKKVS